MELINYLLKVSACSVLFFAFYLVVLRKLTFFKFNRFYLLVSVLLSFIIPASQITIERETIASLPVSEPMDLQSLTLAEPAFETPAVHSTLPVTEATFDWLALLPYLYTMVVTALLLLAAWRIFYLLRHTKSSVKEINGLKLVVKEKGFTNCSFFNYVFIDENSLTDEELRILLQHEEVHAKQYHSADKLVMTVAKALLWFNPVIYLYDKALEQAHEYEADEATSMNFGTELYAGLLLRLAVSKNSNPLIHNFVKSPIKQRIKMLFNSKSKNMKKLIYLLALPIGLGLLWSFTIKINHRVKTAPAQETVKQTTAKPQDSLTGKTVKGKIVSIDNKKMQQVVSLQVGDKVLRIGSYNFKDKVKVGDEISVLIAGLVSFPPPPANDPNKFKELALEPYYMAQRVEAKGKLIWETPQYAFLYEANKARYAWSTIKTIEKNSNGTINKIVLNDKGFTINLNVAAQKFKTNDFKKGDAIVVKFIGEKLTGPKTYATDKMIALYSWPKKHQLINEELYPKFYDENGKQKIYNKAGQLKTAQDTRGSYVPVKVYPNPTLRGSDEALINNATRTTYIKNAIMTMFDGELKAEEVEWNHVTGVITAKKAKFKNAKGVVTESERITFNTKTGSFAPMYEPKSLNLSPAYNLISKLNFASSDSIRVSRIMDETLMLNGNVKLNIDKYKIDGKIVSVNKYSNIITAYSGSIKNGVTPAKKAARIEFDLSTKEIKLYN